MRNRGAIAQGAEQKSGKNNFIAGVTAVGDTPDFIRDASLD